MKIKRILIIGGDARIEQLANLLTADGYEVSSFDGEGALKSAVEASDAVVLGLPASRDDKHIDAPKLDKPILIKDLFQLMGSRKMLLAGKMSESMKAVADVFNVKWIDYFMRGEFEVANAVPTCEGAIQIAMEEMPITLHGANAVVTGYGRIGRLLSNDLRALGANVTVCARKAEARAIANADSHQSAPFSQLPALCEKADVVFNTVPQTVIDRKALVRSKNALIIDLASKPGGVDFDAARDIGVKVIWALGLPGKVAPVSAGKIIKETICNIFSEME